MHTMPKIGQVLYHSSRYDYDDGGRYRFYEGCFVVLEVGDTTFNDGHEIRLNAVVVYSGGHDASTLRFAVGTRLWYSDSNYKTLE